MATETQARVTNYHALPRSKALRGPFTPGTDEVCRTRRERKPERAPRPINIPERRVHTSKCCHKHLAAALPQSGEPPPCSSRAAICCMPRAISGGGSCLGAAVPHQPCRWVSKSIGKSGKEKGKCYKMATETKRKRCESSLRTLRNCFARPIYPRNRRGTPQ